MTRPASRARISQTARVGCGSHADRLTIGTHRRRSPASCPATPLFFAGNRARGGQGLRGRLGRAGHAGSIPVAGSFARCLSTLSWRNNWAVSPASGTMSHAPSSPWRFPGSSPNPAEETSVQAGMDVACRGIRISARASGRSAKLFYATHGEAHGEVHPVFRLSRQ